MTFIFYLTLILFVCVLFQGHEEALTWSPENPDTDAFGLQNQTERNRLMYLWFVGMCWKDRTFCL
jgi:hypothetical protein